MIQDRQYGLRHFPQNTSVQKAELIALIQALELAKEKRVTIFTDSRYAFGTAHIQGPIYQERGFRTAEGEGGQKFARDSQAPGSCPTAPGSSYSTCPPSPERRRP